MSIHPSDRTASRTGLASVSRQAALLLCGLILWACTASDARAQALVSNLAETKTGSGSVYVSGSPGNFTYIYAAETFTTGAAQSTLNSITLNFDAMNFSNTTFSLRLYSSAGAQPGTLIETLSGSTSPSNGTFSYTSAGSTVLSANTTYWWVAASSTNGVIFHPTYTSSTAETSSAGWTIGNSGYTGSTTTAGVLPTFSATATPFQFSVTAVSAVPEPSTYAAIFGALALGAVAVVRRRRAAVGAQN